MMETIESDLIKNIEALEDVKALADDHSKFYESVQAHQKEIVRDLEAMNDFEDADEKEK